MGVEHNSVVGDLGISWTQLADRVGSVDQVACATPVTLTEGPAMGVRALDVRTIDGLHATVLLDRGMDLAQAWYRGTPLAWVSATGPAHPAFASSGDWRSSFHGGLLATCGSQNLGPACVVDGVRYPEHGALSNIPASKVHWSVATDQPAVIVEGVMREVRVLDMNVELRRRLTFGVASPTLLLEDTFVNLGDEPVPLMVLYHVNLGWPVIDQASQLFGWPSEVRPHPELPESEAALDEHDRFGPPKAGWPIQVFEHLEPESTGPRTVGVINPAYPPTDGLAVGLTYRPTELPHLWRWRMLGRRTYLMGVEPSTCHLTTRAQAISEDLPLMTLAPDATHRVTIEFTIGIGDAARSLAAQSSIANRDA